MQMMARPMKMRRDEAIETQSLTAPYPAERCPMKMRRDEAIETCVELFWLFQS